MFYKHGTVYVTYFLILKGDNFVVSCYIYLSFICLFIRDRVLFYNPDWPKFTMNTKNSPASSRCHTLGLQTCIRLTFTPHLNFLLHLYLFEVGVCVCVCTYTCACMQKFVPRHKYAGQRTSWNQIFFSPYRY